MGRSISNGKNLRRFILIHLDYQYRETTIILRETGKANTETPRGHFWTINIVKLRLKQCTLTGYRRVCGGEPRLEPRYRHKAEVACFNTRQLGSRNRLCLTDVAQLREMFSALGFSSNPAALSANNELYNVRHCQATLHRN
jgi:hypothetical protein